jgi:hypothetical protein
MVRVSIIAALLVAAASSTATALAADPLPAPAVAQYVESIPTGEGPVVAAGATKPHVKKLPPAVHAKIEAEGGKDAAVIEQLATSSAYGAPQTTLTQSPAPEQTPTTTSTSTQPSTSTSTQPSTTSTRPQQQVKAHAKPEAKAPAAKPKPKSAPATAAGFEPQTYWTDGTGQGRVTILAVVMLVLAGALVFASRHTSAARPE